MSAAVDAKTLKSLLHGGGEIALLDVREHGQYGESHPFFGVPLPFSRLEVDLARLVPRRGTRVVVYDDGDLGVAERAAARMAEVGYTDVRVLEGGTRGWHRAGYALFAGVNVPSKAFGELVEHERHTPRVTAAELAAMQRAGDDLVVIDGRPLAEFRKMSSPGATCCPNGELAYRIHAMAPDPATRIVVNCAGRTRSIVGAQTLIDLGIPNPV
ncbi:MAG TPA: rhodanese-like domain-containing protein, partial [Usitatibacter sp.]|nr:rhodanese-like domain-containing protein [Usitatibacter sp.]